MIDTGRVPARPTCGVMDFQVAPSHLEIKNIMKIGIKYFISELLLASMIAMWYMVSNLVLEKP